MFFVVVFPLILIFSLKIPVCVKFLGCVVLEGIMFESVSYLVLSVSGVKDKTANTALRREAMEASGWLQFNTPQPVVWVAVCSNYLAAIDANDSVHYCSLGGLGLRWQRADCKATQLALSPNNHCVWRLHNNVAYALKNPSTTGSYRWFQKIPEVTQHFNSYDSFYFQGPHGEDWLEAATNVRSLAVGDNSAWLVTQDGGIFCQKDLTPDSPISEPIEVVKPCEWPPVKIVCFSQVVIVILSVLFNAVKSFKIIQI